MSEKQSIAQKKRYENPEERKKTSEATKAALARPEIKKKQSEAIKAALAHPEVKVKLSKFMKKLWQDPEYRKKMNETNKGKNSYLYKHGLSKDPLYSRWKTMKQRCYNPKCKSYKNYGGRGIQVCQEWKNDFLAFYNWAINNGYQKELEIDRKDNDGNYTPENCRFVTRSKNNKNRRKKRQ